MDFTSLFLIAVTVVLILRALYASAVLHRPSGWVVAMAWVAGLGSLLVPGYEWLTIPCGLVLLVGEFIYQTGDEPNAPPARRLNPLLRRLPTTPPGRHKRKTHHPEPGVTR